jgi:uncharacterized protein
MSLVDLYYQDLIIASETICILPGSGSPLFKCGYEIVEMIQSYLSDAASCEAQSDTINQLASLWYAHGWLEGGCFIGLLRVQKQPVLLMLSDDELNSDLAVKLSEKAYRYQKMLNSALSAITPAPAGGSPLARGCNDLIQIIETWQVTGDDHIRRNEMASGLACSCFGYGLLDAGIRSGLFRLMHSYHLFTTEP